MHRPHGEYRPRRSGENREKQQVVQLQRVIRMQNYAIVGLASLFATVIISTLVLVQRLPHPEDERPQPFWSTGKTARFRQSPHLTKEVLHELDPARANCPNYGCVLRAVEMSRLNGTAPLSIASRRHILLTHKSNRQKPAPINQDRAVLVPRFCDDADTAQSRADTRGDFLLGLFDGHGDAGHEVAQFASDEIPARLAAKLHKYGDRAKSLSNHTARHETIKNIFTETFLSVESDVSVDGGTTAAVVLRRGPTLYLANTGDSTSYVAVYRPPSHFTAQRAAENEAYVRQPRSQDVQLHLQGSVAIFHQNEKHKAHFPREKVRIEARGGKIHVPPHPMGSRVIVRSATKGEAVGLAMSRSIGDREWTEVGVIPDPDVIVVDLHRFWFENDVEGDDRVFVVAGSDGIFDARTAEFVARHLAFGLFESRSTNETGRDPEREFANHFVDIGKKLVAMAAPIKEEFYRDDITFVAHVVEL